jgi:hypothetical protein
MMEITLVGRDKTYGTAEVDGWPQTVLWKGKVFAYQFEYGGPGSYVEQAELVLADDAVTPPS